MRPGVDLDGRLGSQRPRDDRTLWMLCGLLLCQFATLDELLDQRVILRKSCQRAAAEQVGAAVADVGDRHLGIAQICGRQRRAHARPLVLGARHLVDALVGLVDSGREPLLSASGIGEALPERVDRDP